MTELSAVPRRCVQRRYGFIFPRYNAPRCNAAKDALRPAPEFTPRHFKQDDAERQGRDSNAERVEPDFKKREKNGINAITSFSQISRTF